MKLVCYDPFGRRNDLQQAVDGFPAARYRRAQTLDDLATEIADADALVVGNRAYSGDVAAILKSKARKLAWIQFTTSGIDNARTYGLPAGVTVTNAAGLRAFSVAEHALSLMLAIVRQYRRTEDAQRDRTWGRDAVTPRMDNLAGKRLMIVGLGAIGQEIARKAKAFDMHVTGVSRSHERPPHVDVMRPRAELRDAATEADVVVIAANYDEDTKGLIDSGVIGAMKPDAYLINIARGQMVDEPALIDALRNGRIAGAGLDVASIEPLPAEHPFYSLPNVILTPHVGGAGSEGTGAGMGRILSENLGRWLEGQPLTRVVIQKT